MFEFKKLIFPLLIIGIILAFTTFLIFPMISEMLVFNQNFDENLYQTNLDSKGWKSFSFTSGYHDYSETITYINAIITSFPSITCLNDSIGQSIEGRDIFALKISDNPSIDENEPEILFFAQMHAREVISLENILALIYYLCENYGVDSNITNLVDTREIWLIPILNPDGAEYCAYYDSTWRKNRRNNGDGTFGVDLNRNFDYHWGSTGSSGTTSHETFRGLSPFSEPEAQCLRDFVNSHNFSVAVSMHSYSGLWLFPWGYTSVPCADNLFFSSIAIQLTKLQPNYAYTVMSSADFYYVSGDSTDWLYGIHNIFGFTIEIYNGRPGSIFQNFNPDSSDIVYETENNIPPFLYLISIADDPKNTAL